MGAVMLINPRRKRRSGGRRKMSALQRQYFGKGRKRHRKGGRAVVVAVNPRRRRKSLGKRRGAVVVVNPKRRRSRRGSRITIIRRNPISMNPNSFISGTVIPAGIGVVGALLVDAMWGSLPIPAALNSGAMAPVARIGAALLVGMAAGAVVDKRFGAEVAAGAVMVTIYDVAKSYIQTSFPQVQLARYNGLGWYNPGVIVGRRMGRVGRVGRYAGTLKGIPRMPRMAGMGNGKRRGMRVARYTGPRV